MSFPFMIRVPNFSIDNRTRDIYFSFSTLPKIKVPKVITAIHYWSITDNKGCVMRDEPVGENSVISASNYGKKFHLLCEVLDIN